MPILIFKTNIASPEDCSRLETVLAVHPHLLNWNVDTQDIDKVLRIESSSDNTSEIIHLVQQAGYACEELTD